MSNPEPETGRKKVSKKKNEWRVWAHFWTAPKARKFGDYPTKIEAETAAEQLNASPSGKYTDYFIGRI